MLRRKLQFLIVLGVIFSSLTGLLGVRTRTFAETNTKVLIDETFLNVSYETELTEEGNVFRIKMKREADSEQKKKSFKAKNINRERSSNRVSCNRWNGKKR